MELERIDETASFLRSKIQTQPEVLLVLGSGLGSVAENTEKEAVIPYSEIPNFKQSTVVGHAGELIIGRLFGVPTVTMKGRLHFYEGYTMNEIVFPLRCIGRLGIKKIIMTNASGSLKQAIKPGSVIFVKDHMNFMGANPLSGPNIEQLGPRFPDITDIYSKRMRAIFKKSLQKIRMPYREGIYAATMGPSYESAAENRFYAKVGCDIVGMSTVPEAIAAHHMGIDVAVLSCVTNYGTGVSKNKLSHDEVTEAGKSFQKKITSILKEALSKI